MMQVMNTPFLPCVIFQLGHSKAHVVKGVLMPIVFIQCLAVLRNMSCAQEHVQLGHVGAGKRRRKGSNMLLKDLHLILKTWTTQPFPRLTRNLNPLTTFLTWRPVLGPSILSHRGLRSPAPGSQDRPCTASGSWGPDMWLVCCWVFIFLINRLFRAVLDLH